MSCKEKSSMTCDRKCVRGQCQFVDNKQICICEKEYDGEHCDHYRCSGYCHNRGVCSINDTAIIPDDHLFDAQHPRQIQPPLKCLCPSQFTGNRCQIPVSICKVSLF